MQTCMTVSAGDLRFNAKAVKDYVGTEVIAVVKCNGYGVTIEYAVAAWYAVGVRFFAVSEPEEALAIRSLGYHDVRILLMSPVSDPLTLTQMLSNDIILTVTSAEKARFYVENCAEYRNIKAHVKVDTGMGRFGVRYDDTEQLNTVYAVNGIEYTGIFSHFAMSFEPKYNRTKCQLQRFLQATQYLQDSGINVGTRHIANSCAAIRFPETRLDAVRIGSALVGRLMTKTDLELKKVGFVRARVVDIKTLKKGDTTGYAMIAKIKRETKCAVVAIGYREGYGLTRANDNMRFVDLIRNIYHALREYKVPPVMYYQSKRLKVIGRIGNQYTLVDITDTDIKQGDIISADVNVLMVDSLVSRVSEQ